MIIPVIEIPANGDDIVGTRIGVGQFHNIEQRQGLGIIVTNDAGTAYSIFVSTPGLSGGQPIADATCLVPATTGFRVLGNLDDPVYRQPDGTIEIYVGGGTTSSGITVYPFVA